MAKKSIAKINNGNDKVRDGYFKDLPEEIQNKVMNISKIVRDKINDLLNDPNYEDLKSSQWAMSCIDEFILQPTAEGSIGSIRVFKKGRGKETYSCMIQLTGHFRNHQYGWIEELLHEIVKRTFAETKAIIRKKYDMTIKNEGDMGNPDEGFDVYPSSKVAEEMWNKLEDRKTKTITESGLEIDDNGEILFEKSHGKLNYEFRFVIGEEDGHLYKIVYSLNPDNIISDNIDSGSGAEKLRQTIRSKGNSNYVSKGNKILAIIDVTKNHRVDSVNAFPPIHNIGGNISPQTIKGYMGIFKRFVKDREEIKKEEERLRKEYPSGIIPNIGFEDAIENSKRQGQKAIFYKVGEIDKTATYKTTDINKVLKGMLHLENTDEDVLTEGIFDILSKNKKEKFKGGRLKFELLPEGLRNICKNTTTIIREEFIKSANSLGLGNKVYHIDDNSHGGNDYNIEFISNIIAGKNDNYIIYDTWVVQNYHTDIVISSPVGTYFDINTEEFVQDVNKILNRILNNILDTFNKSNPGKTLKLDTYFDEPYHDNELCFILRCDTDYTEKLINYINDQKKYPLNESVDPESNPDYNKEYNTEMTEKQAKQTLRTLSQSIINNYDKDDMGKGKNKINQYTANIYANIITKNLLPKWAPGFKKLSITLDSYQSFFTFEFKTPTMSQDFVSRFIEGREQISGFLHRVPEIKIRMSPRIFHTMKNADDAYNFFKSAITYYNSGLEKTSVSLMVEARKLGREIKHLISTTKLSGLVTLPLSLLFVFEDVHMDNKDVFRVNKDDIKTINQFMKNIYTRYAAPEKEKSKIINDVREMVKELRESCGVDSDTMRDLYYFPEAVEIYFNGGYDNEMRIERERFELEQVDMEGTINPVDPQSKYYMEKFGVKKLKKIPTDLVAYISIETEAIKDANDKMMIASYTLGKIEIVEWYIELLEVGSKKYIVPHSKPYLENVRTQLLACFKKIMDTPIPKNDRPIMDIKYPKGYEG